MAMEFWIKWEVERDILEKGIIDWLKPNTPYYNFVKKWNLSENK